jgi:hypothetical protein
MSQERFMYEAKVMVLNRCIKDFAMSRSHLPIEGWVVYDELSSTGVSRYHVLNVTNEKAPWRKHRRAFSLVTAYSACFHW